MLHDDIISLQRGWKRIWKATVFGLTSLAQQMTMSHCDIAWAGALASHAHTERKCQVGAAVLLEDGTILSSDRPLSREQELLLSEDPRIWRPLKL